MFAGLLPDALLARSTKAHFNDAFFGTHSHTFARSWDGTGLPEELIDRDALVSHWSAEAPTAKSFTLLQAAWLASARDRRPEPREHVVL